MGVRHWESCSSPNNLNGNMIVAALALPQLQASSQPNATQAVDSGLNSHDSLATPQHPLGIKPAGNVYLADANIKGSAGYFATLPDELIVQVLEFLDAVALRQLQHTCKALFAFTRLEDLWKIICVEPFILTDTVREWPVYRDWSLGTLLEEYGDIRFRAEAVDWPLKTYVDYMNENNDESPLYLFDCAFVEKMGLKHGKDGHYWAPDCFGEDLFSVLGDQRPDSRWLIIGPERSGSSFHKDPNATSAWNAVLKGSKYWIMFPTSPSQPPPPGVFVSEDQSEVTSPLSVAEWLLGFHTEARRTPGCMEGICKAGEVLHVPSGWWHLVVNLEPSIAITQNFVPKAHLTNVLDFLKNKADQISGFKNDIKDVYGLFVQKMGASYPCLLDEVLGQMERLKAGKKRKWDELVEAEKDVKANAGGFSFGFGDGDEEDVP